MDASANLDTSSESHNGGPAALINSLVKPSLTPLGPQSEPHESAFALRFFAAQWAVFGGTVNSSMTSYNPSAPTELTNGAIASSCCA
jgi:hypothetical protein